MDDGQLFFTTIRTPGQLQIHPVPAGTNPLVFEYFDKHSFPPPQKQFWSFLVMHVQWSFSDHQTLRLQANLIARRGAVL